MLRKKAEIVLCCLAVAGIMFGPAIQPANADCWIRELVAASTTPCAACVNDSCPGNETVVSQYYICQSAGTGEDGKDECYVFPNTKVGDIYACDVDWDITGILACLAGTVGCAAACATAATGIGVAACIACLAGLGLACAAPCNLVDGCVRGTDVGDVKRSVFSRLAGSTCTG